MEVNYAKIPILKETSNQTSKIIMEFKKIRAIGTIQQLLDLRKQIQNVLLVPNYESAL